MRRREAEADADESAPAAERDAKRIVAEATRRKADIEAVISDLEQRRDAVLAELDRLASGIAGDRDPASPATREPTRREPATDATGERRAEASRPETDRGLEPSARTAEARSLASRD